MNVRIDISNVILKTDRLILRPWTIEDLDDFYEYAKVDGVGQMAGWYPHKNKEETLMILNMFIDEKKTFAIVYDDKVIGSLGIEEYDEKELPEYQNKKGREIESSQPVYSNVQQTRRTQRVEPEMIYQSQPTSEILTPIDEDSSNDSDSEFDLPPFLKDRNY